MHQFLDRSVHRVIQDKFSKFFQNFQTLVVLSFVAVCLSTNGICIALHFRPEKGMKYSMPEQRYSSENLKNMAATPPGKGSFIIEVIKKYIYRQSPIFLLPAKNLFQPNNANMAAFPHSETACPHFRNSLLHSDKID